MFNRESPGYTIVETMIFLAVSGVILAAALALFQGQQGKTQFDQSVKDLNSKIQKYVQDVNSGYFQGSSNYNCQVVGGGSSARAQLNNNGPATGLGTNTECIFLGKAISVSPDKGAINVYTVLGDRIAPTGPNAGQPVSTISEANPEPAQQPCCNLTEQFFMLYGTVVSPKVAPVITYTDATGSTVTATSYLVAFYNDLQGNKQGGAEDVVAKGYVGPALSNPAIQTCIEESNTGVCSNYVIQSWGLCLVSGSSNQTALLQINSTSLGIATKTIMGGC